MTQPDDWRWPIDLANMLPSAAESDRIMALTNSPDFFNAPAPAPSAAHGDNPKFAGWMSIFLGSNDPHQFRR